MATGISVLVGTAPDTTGGAYPAIIEQTTRQGCLGFVQDVAARWYGRLIIPANYASGGTFKLMMVWSVTSGVARMNIEALSVSDGEDFDPTLTANTAQDISVPGTSLLAKLVTFTGLPTLQVGDTLLVAILHDGAHANDTVAGSTFVHSAWLEYVTT